MKRTFLLNTIVLLLISMYSCNNSGNATSNDVNEVTKEESVLRHVVLFKFKDDAPSERIKEAEASFKELPSKIPQIIDFEWGINNSPEGINKGFTHCFFLTFNSEEDRDIYLPHPDHKAFGEVLDGILEDVLVVDYWTTD